MKPRIISLTLSLIMLCSAARGQQPAAGKPLVLGRTIQMHSAIMAEQRTINIYLPPNYKPGDTTHYSVIYLLDGGADEDFIHIAGLVQFNSFPWVGRLPATIVIGIANTDRKRDLTYPTTLTGDKAKYPTTGGSAKFMAFIGQELEPYIRKHYRTTGERTLIGESLGGLFAAEVLYKEPDLFDKYIIVSPSLWWDDGSLLRLSPAAMQPGHPKDVYIAVGKEGLTPGDHPHVMEVDANLLADQLKTNKNLTVYLDYLPAEDHGTIMHKAVMNAIKALFPAQKDN